MIIVVGTSHTIQTTTSELKPFLDNLCREFKVCVVAEEMSKEALAENNCTASIPMQVASAQRVPHLFCDPNREERARLEIHQENDIRIKAFLSTVSSETEITARIAESHAKRERYWLQQLRNLNTWPVLFICGADHVTSFCQLLRQEGIAMHLAEEDWIPKTQIWGVRNETATK